jgi:hypothetical protein
MPYTQVGATGIEEEEEEEEEEEVGVAVIMNFCGTNQYAFSKKIPNLSIRIYSDTHSFQSASLLRHS